MNRWLLLSDEADAARRLADAVAAAGSPLASLRLDHGLVTAVGLHDLGQATANALNHGLHTLRIHGTADAARVLAALRPVLEAQQANRTQYVHAGDGGLAAMLSELRRPDAGVLIGWWQSRGTVIPDLGGPGADVGFIAAAAKAFDAWADTTGARDALNKWIESGEDDNSKDELDNTLAPSLQPVDTGEDADMARPFELRALPGGPAVEASVQARRWRSRSSSKDDRPPSGTGWVLALRKHLHVGKVRKAADTADLVEVFVPPGAGAAAGAVELRFHVCLHTDLHAARLKEGCTGIRLEIHLPHRPAIVVALDSKHADQTTIRLLARDRLPENAEDWQLALCRLCFAEHVARA
jgi:hypothetical protein